MVKYFTAGRVVALIGLDIHSFIAGHFHFVFVFLDDAIRIYTGQNGTNSFQYQYQHKLPFERITSFEVWDDLETVQEIAFRYSNSNN